MFENVLGQEAVIRLAGDLEATRLPPALLFAGPPASAKGTAALELARVLSCEHVRAPWNCPCSSCTLHRLLSHPDLLVLGSRSFSSEIAASADAYLREGNAVAQTLFIRSVRKLLLRFSPVLWEGEEAKLGKASSLAVSLGEDLEELSRIGDLDASDEKGNSAREKLLGSCISTAVRLESEGISDTVPISQIRRANYWARLAPNSKKKLLLIENADRMLDGSRNALLKILEEPPERCIIVLTSSRRNALLPTILSRVRPYIFHTRELSIERDVIRRVFRDPDSAIQNLASYLDSYLPVPATLLQGAAAFFVASAAAAAVPLSRLQNQGTLPPTLIALGKTAAAEAESAGFGRPSPDCTVVLALVQEKLGKFEPRSLFSVFLAKSLSLLGLLLLKSELGTEPLFLASAWSKAASSAESAVSIYNQAPALALERLFLEYTDALARIGGSSL